jgi:hypothetical protein
MKRSSIVCLVTVASLSLAIAQQPGILEPLTNARIVQLAHSGIQQDELRRIIQTAPAVGFDLSPAAESTMMESGVSDETIKAMAARESGIGPSALLAPLAAPIVPVAARPAAHSHRARKWIVVGVIGVAASGAAYAGYRLSNPHHCGPVSFYPAPNPTCN